MHYLNREAAGFSDSLWAHVDKQAVEAARSRLTGRRFLEVDGPYGLGLTSLELGQDGYCRQPDPDEAGAILSRAISVPMLRREFQLSIRRIEAYEQFSQPLDLSPIAEAAEAIARREEEFIYHGNPDFGLEGLLTAQRRQHHEGIGDWSSTADALEDVLGAVNRLDSAGLHGPYALALAPSLYNSLFRRYEGTDMLQLEHLRRLCELGVYKAAIEGGVLVDPRVGQLVIGQDLAAGYTRQDGIHYTLHLSESLVLRLDEPKAICTLTPKQG